MKIFYINKTERNNLINLASQYINAGGLVIAKADTSYTILSDPNNKTAQKRMAKIKNDRNNKPISIFVDNKEDIICQIENEKVKIYIKQLLPNMITVIANINMPGMRYIRRKTINQIIGNTKHFLTATSANPSGLPPARNISDIRKYFGNVECMVLYEGLIPDCSSSTIIAVIDNKIKVLRQGPIKIDSSLALR